MSDEETHSDGTLDPILTGFGVLAVVAGLTLTAVLMAGRPKYDHADLRTVAELKLQQSAANEGDAAWVDKEKGIVSLPVSRAAEVVVSEIQRNPALATREALPAAMLSAGGAGSTTIGTVGSAAGSPAASGAAVAPGEGVSGGMAPAQAPAEDAVKPAKKKAGAHKGAAQPVGQKAAAPKAPAAAKPAAAAPR